MKKANEFLTELITYCQKNGITICYSPSYHPAVELDEYMKEQYFTLLFSVLSKCESDCSNMIAYVSYLCKKADFVFNYEKIVKNVFELDEKKKQDMIVSFCDEEIKYLLGFELFVIENSLNQEAVTAYVGDIYKSFEISENDKLCFLQIKNVLDTMDFSKYDIKEYYPHRKIFRGYLDLLNFEKERCVLYAKFPKSKDNSLGGFFEFLRALAPSVAFSWKRIDNFQYVEKGWVVSQFDSYEAEILHAENCTQVIAEKSGIICFVYPKDNQGNEIHISKWCGNGEPFAIIFHQLDDKDKVIKTLCDIIRNNKC